MTDKEMTAANAEYDALPGTPPDRAEFFDYLTIDGPGSLSGIALKWSNTYSAKWVRLTEIQNPDGPPSFWLEGWKEPPRKPTAPPTQGPESKA